MSTQRRLSAVQLAAAIVPRRHGLDVTILTEFLKILASWSDIGLVLALVTLIRVLTRRYVMAPYHVSTCIYDSDLSFFKDTYVIDFTARYRVICGISDSDLFEYGILIFHLQGYLVGRDVGGTCVSWVGDAKIGGGGDLSSSALGVDRRLAEHELKLCLIHLVRYLKHPQQQSSY